MAGPLSGVGGQQIPLATSFTPGQQGSAVRPQNEKQPKPNQVQPQGVQAAQTQESPKDTRNTKDLAGLLKLAEETGERGRGGLVDITV